MAKLLKLRRGTTAQHSSFTGAEGEVTVDTTKDTLVVHDGSTAGGKPLATEAGNIATATTATNVTVADESTDTSCNVLFTTAATGNLPPKSGTNLTFNSNTGILTATGFAGDITGDVTGDVTGNVTGNTSGTAATVTGAAQSNITSTGTLTGLTVTGDVVLDNGTNAGKDITWDASADALIMNDDVQLQLGTGSDMRFYHSGSHGYLNVVTGNLEVRTNSNENAIVCTANAGVALYNDNVKTFETLANGIVVNGTEGAAAFIYLHADEGDDNADKWNINAATGGDFKVQSYSGGSWADELVLTNAGNLTATGNVTAYSDARLKTDVETIDNALEKVTKLRGVSFTKTDTQEKGIGVIAQEIEEILPEVVQDGAYKSVAYGNIVGVLIEAIKELKAELDEHKKTNCGGN